MRGMQTPPPSNLSGDVDNTVPIAEQEVSSALLFPLLDKNANDNLLFHYSKNACSVNHFLAEFKI